MPLTDSGGRGKVLVTGGTGLIGGEVIKVLLERGWSVKAVARGADDSAAGKRIRERLQKSGLASTHFDRLTCLAGSVTEPRLGLRESAFGDVATLLHAAGETAFNNDESCWKTNVGAAERLVELGRDHRDHMRMFFMSTASVCMHPTGSVITEDSPFGGFENGYTRSKRQAETVFASSGLDVVILRPTIVFSRGVKDRKMARAMLWVIPAIVELGSAPVDAASKIDIAPVDYVAHAVELMLRRPSLKHRLYHISAGEHQSASCGEMKEAVVAAHPRAGGIRFRGASPGRGAGGETSILRKRLEESISFYVPFMSANITYSNERIMTELGKELGPCPKVTEYIVSLLGQFEFQEGLEESARP